jgi:hypothetical protein
MQDYKQNKIYYGLQSADYDQDLVDEAQTNT